MTTLTFNVNFAIKSPAKPTPSTLTIDFVAYQMTIVTTAGATHTFAAADISKVQAAKDKPEEVNPAKLFFLQVAIKDTNYFIQTFNPPGYDHAPADAKISSPAALLKKEIREVLLAFQSGKPPPTADTPSASTTTSAITTTSSSATSQTKTSLEASVTTPSTTTTPKPTPALSLTIPTHAKGSLAPPEPPVSPTTREYRLRFINSDKHLKEQYCLLVLGIPATAAPLTLDHILAPTIAPIPEGVVPAADFWRSHRAQLQLFIATVDQPVIPPTLDVVSNVSRLSYSTTKRTRELSRLQPQHAEAVAKTKEALAKKKSELAEERARNVMDALQEVEALEYIGNKGKTDGGNKPNDGKGDGKTGVVPGAITTTTTTATKTPTTTTTNTKNSTAPTNAALVAPLPITQILEAQQLSEDRLQWGGLTERSTSCRPAPNQKQGPQGESKGPANVESKERMWLLNNVIKGVNILSRHEVAVTKEELLNTQGEMLLSSEKYNENKGVLFQSDMSHQLENATFQYHAQREKDKEKAQSRAANATNKENYEKNALRLIQEAQQQQQQQQNNNDNVNQNKNNNDKTPQTAQDTVHSLSHLNTMHQNAYSTTIPTPLICLSKKPTTDHTLGGDQRPQQTKDEGEYKELQALFRLAGDVGGGEEEMNMRDDGDDPENNNHNNATTYHYKRHHIKATTMLLRANNNSHNNQALQYSTNYLQHYNHGVYTSRNNNNNNNTNNSNIMGDNDDIFIGTTTITGTKRPPQQGLYGDDGDGGFLDLVQHANKVTKYSYLTSATTTKQNNTDNNDNSSSSQRPIPTQFHHYNQQRYQDQDQTLYGQYDYVLLSDVAPIDTTLLPALPAGDATQTVLTTTASSSIKHSAPALLTAQGRHKHALLRRGGSSASNNNSTADNNSHHTQKLDNEIAQLLFTMKELAAHYWLAVKESYIPKPGLTPALVSGWAKIYEKLAKIQERIAAVTRMVDDVRRRFGRNNQKHLAKQIGIVTKIAEAVSYHFVEIKRYAAASQQLGLKVK